MAIVAAPPPFAASVGPVAAAQLPYSWRPGCPVAPTQLRLVRLSYWGFDGKRHTGRLVVNADATHTIVAVFRRLYRERFPIRRMRPVDAYRGSDSASTAADNTSAFNCRNAVASGPVWTPLIPATMAADKVEGFGSTTPLGRVGQPVEIAAAFVFLASDEASYVSGTVLGVTGGKPVV